MTLLIIYLLTALAMWEYLTWVDSKPSAGALGWPLLIVLSLAWPVTLILLAIAFCEILAETEEWRNSR